MILLSISIVLLLAINVLQFFNKLSPITEITPKPVNTPPPKTVVVRPCGGAFSDGFHDGLNPKWIPVNMDGMSSYSDSSGYLILTASPNSDLNSQHNNYSAPRILQPIRDNFSIYTQLVSFSATNNYQGTGILLWESKTEFLRFELIFGKDRTLGINFQKEDGSGDMQTMTAPDQYPETAGLIDLQLTKQGNRFVAWWRMSNQKQNWNFAGATTMNFDNSPIMAGLDIITAYSAPQTTATYRDFLVSCNSR